MKDYLRWSLRQFYLLHFCPTQYERETKDLDVKGRLLYLLRMLPWIAAFIVLGLTFVTTGTIWCLVLAWFASSFSERLRNNDGIAQWLNRTAGALFVFLGLRLATAK